MSKSFKNIKNVHVSAIEDGKSITFLHKVEPGAVDKSYGIHVAHLANMPEEVINRASEILSVYENKKTVKTKENNNIQLEFDLFLDNKEKNKDNEIIEKIKNLDVLKMTPMDAMNVLYELNQDINKSGKE